MLSSLSSSEVTLNLNPNQLKDIVQKADDAQVQRVKNVVEAEFLRLSQPIKDRIDNNIIGARTKEIRNKELRRLEEDERAGVVPVGTTKTARARFTTTAPAWDI